MDSKRIVEKIRSGVSGLHIQSGDYKRVDKVIGSIATELDFRVSEWNRGYGWVDFKTKQPRDSNAEVCLYKDLQAIADDDPSTPRGKIYVIQDARSALENSPGAPERLKRELLRLQTHFGGHAAILLVAKEGISFPAFSDLIKTFPCPPLASDEVKAILTAFQAENDISMAPAVKNKLISTCSGMEEYMVLQVLKILKNNHGQSFAEGAVDDAVNQKKSFLSQSGLLELIDAPINMAGIGGLGRFKRWLRDKKKPIMDDLSQAQEYGIAAPKGVLLAGMPGCGKSMSAKAAASLFNVPLLRLDVGSVMGKFVGESEANMKAALQVAETASPCVLWMDELEKAFAGVNSSGGSTEITTRLFGYFLTWMQEKPGAVFVVATVNDLSSTPPELLRRGRFDEIFYIDLPAEFEREEIFELKIKGLSTKSKAAVNVSQNLDFAALAENSEGFSGADIEQVIQGALTDLFLQRNSSEENLELTQADLARHIQSTTPMSVALKDKVQSDRKNFEGYKLENASFSEEEHRKFQSTQPMGVVVKDKIQIGKEQSEQYKEQPKQYKIKRFEETFREFYMSYQHLIFNRNRLKFYSNLSDNEREEYKEDFEGYKEDFEEYKEHFEKFKNIRYLDSFFTRKYERFLEGFQKLKRTELFKSENFKELFEELEEIFTILGDIYAIVS